MSVEEEHQDILQNMEFAIVEIYRAQRDLIEAEVLTAIEALVRIYGAEAQGKTLASRPVRGVAQEVMVAVQEMCEWRMGRSSLEEKPGKAVKAPPPESVEVIVACLKRIQSSIKFWSKKSGRQGYLDFVSQFIQ